MAFRSVLARLGGPGVANKHVNHLDHDFYRKLMPDCIEFQRDQRFPKHLKGGVFYSPSPPCPQPPHDPTVMAYAHLAVQEFNKLKLRFVRAVQADYQTLNCFWGDEFGKFYFLTLEAADAQVVKTYQAVVNDYPQPWLQFFGLVADDGSRTRLERIDEERSELNDAGVYLDKRERRPDKEIRVPFPPSWDGDCVLRDEFLGSLRALPLQ